MNAKSPNVGARLTGNPNNPQIAVRVKFQQFGVINRSDAQLSLDGRYERWTLEECTGECLDSPVEFAGFVAETGMETYDRNIFLSGRLLCLDESGGSVNANNETARDFRIERAGMARLFDAEDALDPRDDFMGRWIGGFV